MEKTAQSSAQPVRAVPCDKAAKTSGERLSGKGQTGNGQSGGGISPSVNGQSVKNTRNSAADWMDPTDMGTPPNPVDSVSQSLRAAWDAMDPQAASAVPMPSPASSANASTAAASGDSGSARAVPRPCGGKHGELPGICAPMAFPYVPMQERNPVRFSRMEALETGTLFPGLHLPFKAAIQAKTKLNNTALVELMALDFAIDELGLYLTTHADDQEALQLYWSYVQMSREGRERYQQLYGPLFQTSLTPEDGFIWLNDPWPWEIGGND